MRQLVRLGLLAVTAGTILIGLNSDHTPLIAVAAADPGGIPAYSPSAAEQGYFPGQVLVKYKSSAVIPSLRSAQAMPGMTSTAVGLHAMEIHPTVDGLVVMKITGDVHEAITEFEKDPNVEFAEPSWIRYLARTPNDTYFPQQTNMAMSRATLGWDVTTSATGAVVAVIDTGVDLNHPDLQGNLLPGFNTRGDQSGSAMDDSGHGTAVCGVIGAVGDNGQYTAGCAWSAKILPIRTCGTAQLICTIPDEVEAIDIAIAQGADVINLSLGGYSAAETERLAINRALAADIVVVAAAGNGIQGNGVLGKVGDPDLENNLFFPAAYDGVIGVGSIDPLANPDNLTSVKRSQFSNYGDAVDVVAVGNNVVTLAPSVEVAAPIFRCDPGACYYTQKVGQISGTSFSSPLVAGLAVLLRSQFPDLDRTQIASIITTRARDLGTQDAAGRNDEFGFGLVDFFTTLSAGSGGTSNDTWTVGVAANPIFPNQIYVVIRQKQALQGGAAPTVTVEVTQTGKPLSRFTPVPSPLDSDPNVRFGRFRVDGKAEIKVTIEGHLAAGSHELRTLVVHFNKEA
ncbi:MAG: S8 family serine peptidase [bacterium]